jgi:hypothetical protein
LWADARPAEEEITNLKHLKHVSTTAPKQAAEYQDLICVGAAALAAFLGFLGGESPAILFIDDKCAIPAPNEGGSDN